MKHYCDMIYDAIRMAGYDEAAPAGNGSDTDGVAVKAVGLPMSVMSLHVHLFASDHSEMASYIDRFTPQNSSPPHSILRKSSK